MLKKVLVVFVVALMFLSFSQRAEAQLCQPASFYDALAWTWEYLGPCTNSYNCLGYATGSMTWEWPWGGNLPTDSQVTSYLGPKGYSPTGATPAIISYGTLSGILHFSKVVGPSTCEAKCGGTNLLTHYSWDPYKPSGSYGPKVRVYKTGVALYVNISGPSKGNNSGTYTWCANAGGGQSPYTYSWKYSYEGTPIYSWGTAQCRTVHLPLDRNLVLRVTVTDANGNTATDDHFTVNMDLEGPPKRGAANWMAMELNNYSAQMEFDINSNEKSPNPYDYIDNEGFRKIVAMGPQAIELIRMKILKSDESGLTEYLLAIAAEKIAAVNLKNESLLWKNGEDWVLSWEQFIHTLPQKVDSIMDSNLNPEERDARLKGLGFAVLPLLEDRISSGDTSLNKIFTSLIDKYENSLAVKRKAQNLNIVEEFRKIVKSEK